MNATLADFSARAVELSDGDIVHALSQLADQLLEFGEAELRASRFSREAYTGPAGPNAITALFADDIECRSLRTLTSISLSAGRAKSEFVVRYERSSPGNAILSVEPAEFRRLEAARNAASQRLQEPSKPHNSNAHEVRQREAERRAAELALGEATASLAKSTDELARRMLACVSACHRVGLTRPETGSTVPNAAEATIAALGEQVAALRSSILSQERNAADRQREIAREYEQRSTALRLEHEERASRLKEEFEARQQRLEARMRDQEAAAQAKLEAVAAREANLELNDEKAERRKLRRELQEATKARADRPDLSEQAKAAFARVIKASGWTVVASAIVLVAAVAVPFWFAGASAYPTELTYLG